MQQHQLFESQHQLLENQHQLFENQHRHELEIQQLQLKVTAREISQLSFENPRTTTTISKQPQKRQDQIVALKNELSQMAKAISNPIHRSLWETAISKMLRQVDDKLGIEPVSEASDSTDSNLKETDSEESHSTFDKQASLRSPDWKIHVMTEKTTKMQNMFCTIYVTFKTIVCKSRYNDHRNQTQNEMSITILPASWLVKFGISYVPKGNFSHSKIYGWKYSFNPYRLVSSNASILELCRKNDLIGVQNLLSRGEASVKDMDSLGRTPLHVSHFIKFNILNVDSGYFCIFTFTRS